ncbi:MAG: methyltransferase domain-containing protein [Burkholderiaceae bacterium]|jgi:malonyl-CoA O-methyltransferase
MPPVKLARPGVDEAAVRRILAREKDEPSFIALEVSRRLAERLELMRLEPKRVLDCHSHPVGQSGPLRTAYPKAFHLASLAGVARLPFRAAHPRPFVLGLKHWFAARPTLPRFCADLDRLPLRADSIDLIWSNLALHWHPEPHRVFPEWNRVLTVGGLLLFSTYGPDTLREVRQAFDAIDAHPHVLSFTDMHDFGDMLVDSGFATPVMDMETITLTYDSEIRLWEDVRALGGNPLQERRRGLFSRGQGARLSEALKATQGADGRLRLTFEVVYGHAWKGTPRKLSDGRSVLRRIDRPPTA